MITVNDDRPPDTRSDLGPGMEQFHHPRPVRHGSRPTLAREFLMRGLSGVVVEIGAGDGVKFALYPPEVHEITAVEPQADLCDTARRGSRDARVPVRVVPGALDDLPVPAESVDVVICSLTLCSAPRPERTLQEIARVLRRGGELRFYEHVRSCHPLVALAQRLVGPLWARAAGGCRPARDPVGAVAAAGFVLDGLDRSDFDHVAHVLGVARRP
ncbi:methyltransferase type 11 [Streptosporangium violaceochromogenes]|nr:methyltransferase type 11 [Streptosporangium violaceochromogenes]